MMKTRDVKGGVMISDKTTRLSMVNNQRVLYNNKLYIKRSVVMGHVVVEITFYNCKVHFRRLINCCECCHTVDSTRLDINYIKCYNSAQKQKVEYK